MKNFLWYVIGGLLYSMLVMSILNIGLPAEVGGKPIPEWTRISYNILTAGWGNFTVITAVSVLAFSAFPWAKANVEENAYLYLPLSLLLACVLVTVPTRMLTVVLVSVLAGAGGVLTDVLAGVLAFVLVVVVMAMLTVVLMSVLSALLLVTRNIIKSTTHNVRLALAKDNCARNQKHDQKHRTQGAYRPRQR